MRNKFLVALFMVSTSFVIASEHVEYIERGVSTMSKDEIVSFFNGEEGDVMVKFSKGDNFPFDFFLSGGIFSLSKVMKNAYYISVEKDFYLRYPEKGLFLVSFDGQIWKSFMEAITGSVFAGLNRYEEEGELVSELSIKLDPREKLAL